MRSADNTENAENESVNKIQIDQSEEQTEIDEYELMIESDDSDCQIIDFIQSCECFQKENF